MTRAREHLGHLLRTERPAFQAAAFTPCSTARSTTASHDAESSTRVSLGKGVVEIEVVHRNLSAPSRRASQSQTLQEKTQLETLSSTPGRAGRQSMRRRDRPRRFSRRRCSSARKKRAPKRADKLNVQTTAQDPGAGGRRSDAPIFADLAVRRRDNQARRSNCTTFIDGALPRGIRFSPRCDRSRAAGNFG